MICSCQCVDFTHCLSPVFAFLKCFLETKTSFENRNEAVEALNLAAQKLPIKLRVIEK